MLIFPKLFLLRRWSNT